MLPQHSPQTWSWYISEPSLCSLCMDRLSHCLFISESKRAEAAKIASNKKGRPSRTKKFRLSNPRNRHWRAQPQEEEKLQWILSRPNPPKPTLIKPLILKTIAPLLRGQRWWHEAKDQENHKKRTCRILRPIRKSWKKVGRTPRGKYIISRCLKCLRLSEPC